MSNKRTAYNFEFIDVVKFLIKWKIQLFLITFAGAVAAYLASGPWFITPKYRSTATFYPGTTNSISSALFFKSRERAKDPLQFGDEENTEQFLQLLESSDLQWRVINRFNLLEHYHIDPDRKDKYDVVIRTYAKNVNIKRTDYNSIEISVMDEDPKYSADIANGIMAMVDTVKNEIQRRVATQANKIIEEAYLNKIAHIDSIKNVMKMMGEKGVYNAAEQSKGIAELVGKGQQNAFTDKEKKALGEYAGEFTFLDELLQYEAENFSELKMRYEQSKVDMKGEMSSIFVIGYAYPPQNKAYPVRSIIVLMSAFSAFVMGCILIVVIERYKQLKDLFRS